MDEPTVGSSGSWPQRFETARMSTGTRPSWWQTAPRAQLPLRLVGVQLSRVALVQVGDDVLVFDVVRNRNPRLIPDVVFERSEESTSESDEDDRRSAHPAVRPMAVVAPYGDDVVIID